MGMIKYRYVHYIILKVAIQHQQLMKQLDVDVSPPAFFINLTLMKTTLGPVLMMYNYTKFRGPRYYSYLDMNYRDMNYCLVNFGPVTDGQTHA